MGDGDAVAGLVPRTGAFPELATLLARVREAYAPVAVLLFGSRARGEAGADSDWDLLVLVPDGAGAGLFDPMVGWEAQRGSGVHADVLCCRVSEFIADAGVANTLAREVVGHAVRVA